MPKRFDQIGAITLMLLFLTSTGVLADVRVLVIPKGTQSVFWESVAAGAQKAGRELGISITYRGPYSEDQHGAQVKIIAYGIRQKFDAIVLAPNHVEMADSALKTAVAEGIKVVLIDSNMNSRHHACFIESNNYKAGQEAADHAAALLNGAGRIALVRYMENHASTQDREQGFMDRLKSRYPQIILTADPRAGTTVGEAYHSVSNLLGRSPSIDAIFSVNEPTTMGTLRALREKQLVEEIKFIGFDCNAEIKNAVLNKEMDATIAQDPFQIGYLGVDTAYRLIQNKPVLERIFTDTVLINAENFHTATVQAIIKANTP
jgi:ribose transport system substrate-binding protein